MNHAQAIAQLRHLYSQMINGEVRDTTQAKRLATGLLGPALEALETEEAGKAVPVADERQPSDGDYLRWAEQAGAKVNWDFESASSARVVFLTASQWGRFCDKVRALYLRPSPKSVEAVADEAVAYVRQTFIHGKVIQWTTANGIRDIPEGTRLYLRPSPKSVDAVADERSNASEYVAFLEREFGPSRGQNLPHFTIGNVSRGFGAGWLAAKNLYATPHPSQPEPTSKGAKWWETEQGRVNEMTRVTYAAQAHGIELGKAMMTDAAASQQRALSDAEAIALLARSGAQCISGNWHFGNKSAATIITTILAASSASKP